MPFDRLIYRDKTSINANTKCIKVTRLLLDKYSKTDRLNIKQSSKMDRSNAGQFTALLQTDSRGGSRPMRARLVHHSGKYESSNIL